ncbi:MAG: hypothetical protein AABX98_00180 [Nanoarchaeota archaeon]|mgnify:FL=1
MELQTVFKRPYVFWLVGIALLYVSLAIIFSKFYLTLWYLPLFFDTLNWKEFIISVSFTFVIGFLVATNIVLAYLHYQENKKQKNVLCITHDRKATIFAGIETFLGLLLGVCSACTPLLFPFLLSIFGVTITLSTLPLRGFELQIILILFLIFNIWYFQQGHQDKKIQGGK